MIERLNQGDTGQLNREEHSETLIDYAEVIKTPSGEGDVWGFRCTETGAEIFTTERFTFRRRTKGTDQ